MPSKKTYHVWDELDGPAAAVKLEAETPEAAAELFAEEDQDGVAAGVYSYHAGHALRVRDPDGDVWEVMVSVDWAPNFNGRRVRA